MTIANSLAIVTVILLRNQLIYLVGLDKIAVLKGKKQQQKQQNLNFQIVSYKGFLILLSATITLHFV